MKAIVLTGDSIRMGYQEKVREQLADRATVRTFLHTWANGPSPAARTLYTSTVAYTTSRRNSAMTLPPFRSAGTRNTCALS